MLVSADGPVFMLVGGGGGQGKWHLLAPLFLEQSPGDSCPSGPALPRASNPSLLPRAFFKWQLPCLSPLAVCPAVSLGGGGDLTS